MKQLLKILCWAGALLVALVVAAYVVIFHAATPLGNPFEPPEMAAARYAPRDAVGDLGGVAVTIPRHFANFLEYDGDPGWGEKRQGPRPERSHQSKISSFGYYTRFPDMAGESSPELINDKRSYFPGNTPWISVGITTGEIYPGDGFLDRWTQSTVDEPRDYSVYEKYEQLPEKEHGLTVYAAAGTDPNTNAPYREHTDATDVFVLRDKTGRVVTTVRCSNRHVPAPPCTQQFSLEPDIQAAIDLSYRRSLLPHWREMQTAVTKQLLSFRHAPNDTHKTVAGAPMNTATPTKP
jgi:hypothetical protein